MVTSLNKETAQITELIRNEQMGEIESVWNEALEKAPTELDTFLSLASTLAKSGHGEKAGNLLEILVTKLDEIGENRMAITALGTLAKVAPRNANQKAVAEVIFNNAFAGKEGLEQVIERATTAAKGSDNKFVTELYQSLMFQPGDWVFHDQGWGLGQVKEIDLTGGKIIIDFEEKHAHGMKMGPAANFLKPLADDHIMVQRAAFMDSLKERCKDDPEAVVLSILRDHENKSTLKRIRAEMVREDSPTVIVKKDWSKWWNNVRKDLAKHHYIKLGTGTNPTIERLVTAMTLEDETREKFDNAMKLGKKLEVIRRYMKDSHECPERAALFNHMADALRTIAAREVELDEKPATGAPTLAGDQILISFLIDDLKKAEADVNEALPYNVDDLLSDGEKFLLRFEEINDSTYQNAALARFVSLNEDKWHETVAATFLKNSPSNWDGISKRLLDAEKGKLFAESLETAMNSADLYPLQYLWLAKRGIVGDKPLPEEFEVPPANELFGRLLWTVNKVLTRIERGEESLKDVLASLRAAMTERQSRLLTTVIDGLDEKRASHVLHEINTCRGLSDIHSQTLNDILARAFPTLAAKNRLATEDLDDEDQGEILATDNGLRKRRDELKHIQEEDLPEVGKQIGEALAMGDISENAELDAAREKEGRLKEHAREIMEELKRVKVVDPSEIDASVAGFGTKVTLKREDGKTKEYEILGRYEADHERGIISIDSPIAQGILGRAPGEEAIVETPEGKVHYDVINVEKAF
ncbi:GreA/GreB family elongation factor [Planctomycetota bacterium]|nr:GreA/GreB family elongation factor [Planctomycetota bacterium]